MTASAGRCTGRRLWEKCRSDPTAALSINFDISNTLALPQSGPPQEVRTSHKDSNPDYLLDSDDEPLRLERQARIYGVDDDLRHLALVGNERVLDAGCGPGAITQTVASTLPQGHATGVDREPRYIDYARRKAASEHIDNVDFKVGDVLNLPFDSESFDVLWSKHLLQWVRERGAALKEF